MCEKYNTRRVSWRACRDVFGRSGRLWPSVCVVCRRAGGRDIDLCDACRACLPPLAGDRDRLCPRCGEAFAGGGDDTPCRRCAERTSPFTRLVVPWRYAFPLDRLIASMKYGDPGPRDRVLARVLGTALAREACRDRAADRLPDALIAVPSRAGRRESGFDHAPVLTAWCARDARLRDASTLASRIVDTGSLAGLSRAARADRIRGAFRADARVAGLRIAIVDDVLTTGVTAGELARELYDTGAVSVELWVLARTPADR